MCLTVDYGQSGGFFTTPIDYTYGGNSDNGDRLVV